MTSKLTEAVVIDLTGDETGDGDDDDHMDEELIRCSEKSIPIIAAKSAPLAISAEARLRSIYSRYPGLLRSHNFLQGRVLRRKGPTTKVLTLFPDGSFLRNRYGGAGVAWQDEGVWHGRAVALGPIRSNNDAEMLAIVEAFKLATSMMERQRQRPEEVVLQTDSEACIQRLTEGKLGDRAIADFLTAEAATDRALLASLGIKVKLLWVKGHSQNPGNERADHLARFGAKRALESPDNWGLRMDNPYLDQGRSPNRPQIDRAAKRKQRRERKLLTRRQRMHALGNNT